MSMGFMHGGSGTLSAYIPIYMNIIIKGSMVIETFEESHPQHTVGGSPIIEKHTRPLTLNRLNYSYDLRKLSNTLTTSS
jgi:hypothetical protein